MRAEPGVLGVFADADAAAAAIRALRGRGVRDVRAAMPAPFPAVLSALGRPRSWLGRLTLGAALCGTLGGFGLCIGTSLDWPLVTAGKDIVSVPPFVIVAFELSVLVGGVVNLIALSALALRARRKRAVPADARFSADRIGVFVGQGSAEAAALLREHGAVEVSDVA
jgi:hypothetical protein